VLSLLVFAVLALTAEARADGAITIGASDWQIIKRESGPVNYYAVTTDESQQSFVRASYRPPMKTAVLGYQVGAADRRRIAKVRWKWRAITLPSGGDECLSGKGDSVLPLPKRDFSET
jgi:hypothetical protein